MNKKVVTILSVVALAFSVAAMALWYTGQGKIRTAMDKLTPLSEFYTAPGTFEARTAAPKKAAEKLAEVRAEGAKKDEDIAAKSSRIASLEGKLKEAESRADELQVKSTNLTRERDDLQGKADALQTKATLAETKVKDLEVQIAHMAETTAKDKEELQKQIDGDKKNMRAEVLAARKFYTQMYNFATSKGLTPTLSKEPWEKGEKAVGPQFIKTVHIGQLVGFDARQALLVINIGSTAGIEPEQGFDLVIADKPVAKVFIADVLNGAVSTAVYAKGSPAPTLTVGTAVKLIPFGVITEDAEAPAPVINVPAAGAKPAAPEAAGKPEEAAAPAPAPAA